MLYFDWPVSGCRDLETPADTWVQRRGNTLRVKCNSSIDTWYLTCTDSRWVGRVGNCSLGKGQWTGAVCERWHGFHVRQRPAFSSLLKGPWCNYMYNVWQRCCCHGRWFVQFCFRRQRFKNGLYSHRFPRIPLWYDEFITLHVFSPQSLSDALITRRQQNVPAFSCECYI